ncbi:hypothetical protein GOP47_0025990, partial [Adiantum capillus-veneris]
SSRFCLCFDVSLFHSSSLCFYDRVMLKAMCTLITYKSSSGFEGAVVLSACCLQGHGAGGSKGTLRQDGSGDVVVGECGARMQAAAADLGYSVGRCLLSRPGSSHASDPFFLYGRELSPLLPPLREDNGRPNPFDAVCEGFSKWQLEGFSVAAGGDLC